MVATNAPYAGTTISLLQACHDIRDEHHTALAHEIARINDDKEWATDELVALSVKLSPNRFSRNRYDSAVHYGERDVARLSSSVKAAGPSAAVRAYLETPGNAALSWLNASDRTFSYLAVDFDARVYKIYLFDTVSPAFLEDVDVRAPFAAAHAGSYIDLLEIDMDDPTRHAKPVYFKLRANFTDALDPGYRPHSDMTPRLLQGLRSRAEIVDRIRELTARIGRVNDPVIKCRPPIDGRNSDGRLCDSDYAVSVNTFDVAHVKYLNDHRRELRDLGEQFGCSDEVGRWLQAVTPFDCFISYVCVGPSFVTIYYKSTTLVRRVPARFVRD